MEMPPLLLLLLLSSLWGCSGQARGRLAVTPAEPVVPYGGSVQLNCSLACAGGTVQWKGLDTNLGSITSFPTHSILHVSSAVVATAGTKICQGTCQGQHYQQAVDLKVYALPERLQLEAEPGARGQGGSVRCLARGLYPLPAVRLTWYRGQQELQADFNVTETEEELFDIESTLPVAEEEVGEGMEFRCEVTLSIRQETFTRMASVAMSSEGTLSTASTVTTPALPPEPSVPPTALTTTRETILELTAATDPPSAKHPAPCHLLTGSPAPPAARSTLPGSGTASPRAEAPGNATESIGWRTLPAEEGTEPACSLRIWSLPPRGTRGRALSIECRAQCSGNATVRWLRTPAALSQYREEAAGSGSTLHLERAEPQHQGHYQCLLLGHRSQVVSLQLLLSDDSFGTGPAIATGTTVSLLGLMVTGIVSHRLWKRFRSQYELS
ncbi:MADCA protein, partial [Bucco capensis]|nr:MADCA protein [Bucco capensis]